MYSIHNTRNPNLINLIERDNAATALSGQFLATYPAAGAWDLLCHSAARQNALPNQPEARMK